MAITWLKRGKPEAERAADDAQVRATVEAFWPIFPPVAMPPCASFR